MFRGGGYKGRKDNPEKEREKELRKEGV